MKRRLFIMTVGMLLCVSLGRADERAGSILRQIGATRGICVLLGDAKCELGVQLARETELLVYLQLPRQEDVKAARSQADRAGLYGTRIFVDKGPLARLHLADDIADALVAADRSAKISEREVLRVLRPGGKALPGRKVIIKPLPKGADDWSHPYHGPDNNPQSTDQVARAPYLTQFLAEPWYCPMPEVTVASGGRIFKTYGITALDLQSGKILWRHPLPGAAVRWGLAIDRERRLLVALQDGRVLCYGPAG